ncbi:anti-sigma factor domain-containing protein [Glutamicibacter sp. AGC13]
MTQPGQDLLVELALNTTSSTERQAALAQIADLPQAQQELDSLQETASLLGLAAPAVLPPARLKANVMQAIRQVEQVHPDVPSAPPVHDTAAPPPLASTREATSPPAPNNAGLPKKLFGLAATVLLLAAGGLGAATWNLNTQNKEQQALINGMLTERNSMKQILSAQDMKSTSQALESGATMRLAYSVAEGLMSVSVTGMPALAEDQGYELWLISADGAIPAGMLDLQDSSGTTMISGSMAGITHLGVTIEPENGSPSPTSDPLMLQDL